MRPEAAVRRVKAFAGKFGQAHLQLARHAAFPAALTPDLLYRLWANFQRDTKGNLLPIPWVAVADLLLSNLCLEATGELYEMDDAVRDHLLGLLQSDPRFGDARLSELATFLADYVRQLLGSPDPGVRDIAEAQHWTALAYLRPAEATRQMAETLAFRGQVLPNAPRPTPEDAAEAARLANLAGMLARTSGLNRANEPSQTDLQEAGGLRSGIGLPRW